MLGSLLEKAKFGPRPVKVLLGLASLTFASFLRFIGKKEKALALETSIHRSALSKLADRIVEKRVK
jgi:hypothetical protein